MTTANTRVDLRSIHIIRSPTPFGQQSVQQLDLVYLVVIMSKISIDVRLYARFCVNASRTLQGGRAATYYTVTNLRFKKYYEHQKEMCTSVKLRNFDWTIRLLAVHRHYSDSLGVYTEPTGRMERALPSIIEYSETFNY